MIRYDRRGHGKSGVPEGPYTMERLGRDVLAVLDALKIDKINWCGLSMGGMVGMWLGANAGNRLNKLILSNTTSYFADKALWEGRIKQVREKGLGSIVGGNMERWFSKELSRQSGERRPDQGLHRQFPQDRRRRLCRLLRARSRRWTTATCCRRSRCRR